MIADEADGRDHHVRRPAARQVADRRADVRLEPRIARRAAAALVGDGPAGMVELLRDAPGGCLELGGIGRARGHRHRHAVRGEDHRRRAPARGRDAGEGLVHALGHGRDEERMIAPRGREDDLGRAVADLVARRRDVGRVALPRSLGLERRQDDAERAPMPGVLHLRERLVQERVPVPHADVDGQGEALLCERASERVGLAARQLVQRRAPADQLVVVRHLFEALRRNAPSRRDDLEERADVLGSLGSSERDQQDRVDAGHREDSSWTMSTRAMTWSTGVSLWTPWPRLKTWPGRPATASRICLAARRISPCSTGEWRGRGSPAPPRRGPGAPTWARSPRASRGRSRRPRPLSSDGKSVAVPVPKWMTGTPGTSSSNRALRIRQHVLAVVGR